jgi:hypothetical protein
VHADIATFRKVGKLVGLIAPEQTPDQTSKRR